LLAQPPELIHPSVVCAAPDGRIFVAQDPIDMNVPSDSAGDSILVIHPDGKITKFADNLHAVFGLYYLDGKLYVHHTPKFSVFTDGGTVGKDRRDLFTTNPNPNNEGKGFNDHIPSNIRLGMDGWFYMSTGDKGIFGATGKDGSHAEVHGGGLMRFRPDGTQLEAYSTGTRNHLDVALNAEDEMFTYDNTDDGNGWWTRVTHMVDGGFYGYPFNYKPRRPYTLWAMADYGSGSPTGAIAYNEDALPPEYRGNLFLCEWGRKQLLRLRVSRDGGTYKVDERVQTEGLDFLTETGKPFRPVGIAISADGLSFYIADWNYSGWRAKNIAGRLLKITYTGPSLATPKPAWWVAAASGRPFSATNDELVAALKHPAQSVRLVAQRRLADRGAAVGPLLKALLADTAAPAPARWHAIWTLDAIDGGTAARTDILAVATAEPDASVRAQAIRQLGTRRAAAATTALAAALRDADGAVRFRAATALGRIADPAAIAALTAALDEKDLFTRYATFTALNRIGVAHPEAWPRIAAGLTSENPAIREGTLFAMRETFVAQNATALIAFAGSESAAPEARAAAFATLADLHHQPVKWDGKWWGTQPVLREAPLPKTVTWAGTQPVLAAIGAALKDTQLAVRRAAVAAVGTAGHTAAASDLRAMFVRETDPELRQSTLQALGKLKDQASGPLVAGLLDASAENAGLVPDAIVAAGQIADPASIRALIALAGSATAPATLTATLEALGATKSALAAPAAGRLLAHPDAKVRAAAGAALAAIGGAPALAVIGPLLDDPRPDTRKAAIVAAGNLRDKKLLPKLLELYAAKTLPSELTLALAKMPDAAALDVYLDGIGGRENSLRDPSRRAIEAIKEKVLATIEDRHRAKPFTGQALAQLQRAFGKDDRALKGPLFEGDSKPVTPDAYAKFAARQPGDAAKGRKLFEDAAACTACHRANGVGGNIGPDLTTVATKYDRAFLIESVLYPSKQILDGYHTISVTMKNGETFAGFIRSQTETETLLVDVAGAPHPLKRDQIAKLTESPTSLMPEGLQATMSLAEFADLIAYLESLREKPAAKGQ
ncbi:MAG: HEAT repeat domain-containing protein, partial [Verrucomicrobia bacterium]|nr:HEAT repeat domain-containing protein [Verrucomicrobiota bacterium]